MESEKHGPAALQGNTGFAASVALLLLRLVVGWVFIYAGGGKLFGWFTADGKPTVEMLKGLGMPPILPPIVWAYMAGIGEFAGGVCILLGLLTRLAAVPIMVTMMVAIAKVTGPNGFGGSYTMVKLADGKDAGLLQLGYAYNLVLLTVAAALLLTGPGLISVDAFIFRRGMWRAGRSRSAPGKREG